MMNKLEDISIDYALMEKAEQVEMIPAGFSWDDLGAWDALERAFEPDSEGNIAHGEWIRIDTRNTLTFNESGERVTVATVGVDDLIIVVTPDAVLVTRPDKAQDVREVVHRLGTED